MLSLIKPDMLKQGVSNQEIPVLIGFLRKKEAFSGQIMVLENLFQLYGDRLKICLGDEYFLDIFFEKFGFQGTPFYLLFSDGKEKNRFFGHAEVDELEAFLKDSGVE